MNISNDFNNLYNFKNSIRHFFNLENVCFPSDIDEFDITELCWTVPISFRVKKVGSNYRVLKFPNVLSYRRAVSYYSGLEHFDEVDKLDSAHKRISADIEIGEFEVGKYDSQLNEDFNKLCIYDCLLKLDIKEYYGKIYTHYLNLNSDSNELQDYVLAGLNNGKTSGILMGNYLSLYFAEKMLCEISKDLGELIQREQINCKFDYFSDDFYFFCNERDIERISVLFSTSLDKYDLEISETKKEIWDYGRYNKYNILTRYWKSVVKHWNLAKLADFARANKESEQGNPQEPITHRLSFLNQIVYRLSLLDDDKSKVLFINNFFKSKHFQEENYECYLIKQYDYHQLCYILKLSPEALLYSCKMIEKCSDFDIAQISDFLCFRYKEALQKNLFDEQMYYFYAIILLLGKDALVETNVQVATSENQILVSYYLIEGIFTQEQITSLKLKTNENYWLQNYHLILKDSELYSNLEQSIVDYLVPAQACSKQSKKDRYLRFYQENLAEQVPLLKPIGEVKDAIDDYLQKRYTLEEGT